MNRIKFVSVNSMVDQFRFPRSKRKRIRAKWAARPENFRPSRKCIKSGDVIYAHPQFISALMAATS